MGDLKSLSLQSTCQVFAITLPVLFFHSCQIAVNTILCFLFQAQLSMAISTRTSDTLEPLYSCAEAMFLVVPKPQPACCIALVGKAS